MRGDDNSPIQVVLPTPDSSDASTITQSDAPVDANREDDLRIYVSGAVRNPGVYRLEQDNRLSASDHSLDIVVLTHLDADHSRGLLEVLDLPAEPLGGTVADQNNNSVVIRIVFDSVSFLLAADIEAMAENYLVRRNGDFDSTVLKVAHHGSRTSTTQNFLSHVDPVVAMVSVGKSNRFSHPHPEIVQKIEQALRHSRVYRTDRHSTVEFVSDGEGLWVSTER